MLWERVALTLWEFSLWWHVAVFAILMALTFVVVFHGTDTLRRVRLAVILGGLLGACLGTGTAFIAHELFFPWVAERLIGLPECLGPACEVGRDRGYIPEIERWTGETQ